MTILFLGEDGRFSRVAALFRARGMTVTLSETLPPREICLSADVLFLPVPATRDGVFLNGGKIPLAAVNPTETQTIVGGRLPPFRAKTFDLLSSEAFLEKNAALTADALLFLLAQDGFSPGDLRVAVLGYGRIGRNLCRRLLACDAAVTVAARREESRAFAEKSGVSACSFDTLPRADVYVNTVPPPFLLPPVVAGHTVIDASGLPPESFPENCDVRKAPALPGRYFKESAARLVFRTVSEYIKGDIP